MTDIVRGSKQAAEMLEFTHRIAEAGAFYSDDGFGDGNAAFYVGQATDAPDMPGTYELVTLPKGVNSDEYISMTEDSMIVVMAKSDKTYAYIETALNLYTDIMWQYNRDVYASEE